MTVYLSASSISDFIQCSQRVLYRIKKPFPEMPTKEMVIGKIAHKAIEEGWKDKEISYQVIDKMTNVYKLSRADNTNMKFFMDIFFLNFRGLVDDGDLIEYSFKFPMFDDVYLVGKMDRISKGNIFDWKTGKVSKRLDNDVQSIIYDYAYSQLFKKKASSICLASLSEGNLVPYRENKIYVDELFNNIIPRMVKTIKDNSYEKIGIFTHKCFRCQYRNGCLGGSGIELDSSISPE